MRNRDLGDYELTGVELLMLALSLGGLILILCIAVSLNTTPPAF